MARDRGRAGDVDAPGAGGREAEGARRPRRPGQAPQALTLARKRDGPKAPLWERPLWRCPSCGHEFAGRNLSHSCGVYDLEQHFLGKPPAVRRLFDDLVAFLRTVGPLKVEAQKTRIVFQVRVRFAGAFPLQSGVRGHFWLTRRAPGPPVTRIDALLPRCYVHHFFLREPGDLNARFRSRLREAYAVGRQEHLRERPRGR